MIRFETVREDMRKSTATDIKLPERATEHSVAYDFFSPVHVKIRPGESKLIFTEVKARFDTDIALLINVRSSMGKNKIMLANTQGWIESDYCDNESNDGNIGINLFNCGTEDYVVDIGDKIAQGMFVHYLVAENGNTFEKRNGGFGSTGK